MVLGGRIAFSLLMVGLCAYLTLGHSPKYQTRLEECPVKKMEIDYTAHGRDFILGNLSVYETVDLSPKRLLIAVHDIFGDTANTRLFSDLLAEAYGFIVVMPDFFRGEPWDHTQWPPNPEDLAEWYENVANYDAIARFDVGNILDYYESTHGITEVGIFGFCWGGLVSTLASTDFPSIKVAGLVHPSNVSPEMVDDADTPMYLFPCLDDIDMLPHFDILKEKFGDNSGHRRYDDMCHGFATSMGNFSNPLLFQRVEQTIDILGNFFVRNLRNE